MANGPETPVVKIAASAGNLCLFLASANSSFAVMRQVRVRSIKTLQHRLKGLPAGNLSYADGKITPACRASLAFFAASRMPNTQADAFVKRD
ncbi:hypothetical protein [Oligoflexus tunisiensis]|uniref:hypothetical protein n=1 Tax=Oligoflexus tunisiensis TaxID=708132 RepID=UPI001C401C49|nr:hypothetical protein [Oligoflexus tunisiensis]